MNTLNYHLSGLTVLVTRPDPEGSTLCKKIIACRGAAIHFPTILFVSVAPNVYRQQLKQLLQLDCLIFNSREAVRAAMGEIQLLWKQQPPKLKVAAIGKGTAQMIRQYGWDVDFIPEQWNSQGLLALPFFQKVKHLHIAIIRGAGGLDILDRELNKRGARVTPLIAYKRILPPQLEKEACHLALKEHKINRVIGTSVDGVRNLLKLVNKELHAILLTIPLIVLSERIKAGAQALGFQKIWLTLEASDEGILQLLATTKGML